MSLNLYDVLDVDETASTADIRAAWRTAVADLDPTDRRFRAYNDAAAVLLDDERRASYDAELAAVRADDQDAELDESASEPAGGGDPVEEPEPEEPDEAEESEESEESEEPVVVEPAPPLPVEPEVDAAAADADAADAGAATEEVEAELAADAAEHGTTDDATTDSADQKAAGSPPGPSAGPPRWAMWVAAVAAVLGVALAVGILVLPGVAEGESPADVAGRADQLRDAGNSAQIAATDTIVPLLGYDYRTMDENLTQIQSAMTPSMADRQAQSWSALTEEAESQQVVVTAEAPYVALTRMSDDGERATVVAFIDQFVKKKDAEPFTLQMWATLTLVRDGDQWLLDDICTEGDCA